MDTSTLSPTNLQAGPFVVVIPAYRPDKKLLTLLAQLYMRGFTKLIVVDDGSGSDYKGPFEKAASLGAEVVHHTSNRGKGAALRTGIKTAMDLFGPTKTWHKSGNADFKNDPAPSLRIITADADGQHLPDDILKVAKEMEKTPGALILGARDYLISSSDEDENVGRSGDANCEVPLKSRLGNRITARLFKMSTGIDCPDTQTGLRGIPGCLIDLALSTSGDRYEYEMHFLQAAASAGSIVSVPIRTVYEDGNRGSHFRPVRDSLLIYGRPIRYTLSSLAGAGTDYALFYALLLALSGLLAPTMVIFTATVLARLCSGSLNFLLNKHWSFKSSGDIAGEALRYFILFVWIMCMSAILVALMAKLTVPAQIAKIFVDSGLFIASYLIQKKWVFAPHTSQEAQPSKVYTGQPVRVIRRRKAVDFHA